MDDLVYKIENNAYAMYPLNHKPSDTAENPFPMYSYERVSNCFWGEFIRILVEEEGLTEDQTVWLLRSKYMRWMFDSESEKLDDFVKAMVNSNVCQTGIKEAKIEKED